MEKITQKKFIELIRAAKNLKINGTSRSNLEIHANYIATRIKINGVTAHLHFAGKKYFYDGKNTIMVENDCFPVKITLN